MVSAAVAAAAVVIVAATAEAVVVAETAADTAAVVAEAATVAIAVVAVDTVATNTRTSNLKETPGVTGGFFFSHRPMNVKMIEWAVRLLNQGPFHPSSVVFHPFRRQLR